MTFPAFYQDNYQYALRIASRVSSHYAEDAVQDVFTYLWTQDEEKLTRPYLAQSVRNRVLWYLRERDASLSPDWDEPDTSTVPESWACREEANGEYRDFLFTNPTLRGMLGGCWTGQERSWLFRNNKRLGEELMGVMG